MALTYEVKVKVHKDETIDRLAEVINDIDELRDLIPDWSQMEAEEISERLYNNLSKCITSEVISGQ